MKEVTLNINIEELEDLYKLSTSDIAREFMSEDLREYIAGEWGQYLYDSNEMIIKSLTNDAMIALHRLMESVAYKYKMNEYTDDAFINFVLQLEEEIEKETGEVRAILNLED